MEVGGKVSYASQEPWMFSSTVRENILYGLPYQKDWYDAVVQACALDKVKRCLMLLPPTPPPPTPTHTHTHTHIYTIDLHV